MTSREGYDAYCLYLAINNHFHTDSYDYFRYGGKTTVKLETFLKRRDKYHFAKLARKYHTELKDFLIANLSSQKYYVGNLLEMECEQNYKEYKKIKQQLTYTINNDMVYLKDKYDDIGKVLEVVDGQHPPILKEYLGGNINKETFISMNLVFGIFKEYDDTIQETFIWPSHRKMLEKLEPFIEFEKTKLKILLRGIWL